MSTTPGVPTRSPIQVLTGPDAAWLQWSDGNWYFQHGMVVDNNVSLNMRLYCTIAWRWWRHRRCGGGPSTQIKKNRRHIGPGGSWHAPDTKALWFWDVETFATMPSVTIYCFLFKCLNILGSGVINGQYNIINTYLNHLYITRDFL